MSSTPQYFFRTTEANDTSGRHTYTLVLNDDLAIHVAALSVTGNKRTHNEDNYLLKDGLLVLCDGMGGHNAGEIASQETCTFIEQHERNADEEPQDLGQVVYDAALHIKDVVDKDSSKIGMGTTAVVARFLASGELDYTHVGDSRLYRIDAQTIEQLTIDHSHVQELFDAGQITREQMKTHILRNTLTASIWANLFDRDKVQQQTREIFPGEAYLLCSDGLTGDVSSAKLFDIIQDLYASHKDDQTAVETLVQAALTAGNLDNITAVIARVTEAPIEHLYDKGIDLVLTKDRTSFQRFLKKYDARIRIQTESAEQAFLLGEDAYTRGFHFGAIRRFEYAKDHCDVTARDAKANTPFHHTLERLLELYERMLTTPAKMTQYFSRMLGLHYMRDDIQETPFDSTLDASLVRRINCMTEELCASYSSATMDSQECQAVGIYAERLAEIPAVHPAILEFYNCLAAAALASNEENKMKQARYFIEQIHAIDASESLHDKEYACLDTYHETSLRLFIGENPQEVIDTLARYEPEDYAGGYGAVLLLKVEAELRQGKKEAALATLEQAVAADFSDERYGKKKEEVFSQHRTFTREQKDHAKMIARYRKQVSETAERYALSLNILLDKTKGNPTDAERKYADYLFDKAYKKQGVELLACLASSYIQQGNLTASDYILKNFTTTQATDPIIYTTYAAQLRAESPRNERKARYYEWKAKRKER